MPFVTEELWQRLPRCPGECDGVASIMLAPYPQARPEWADAQAEADMEAAQAVVRAMRSLRAAYNLARVPAPTPPPPTHTHTHLHTHIIISSYRRELLT